MDLKNCLLLPGYPPSGVRRVRYATRLWPSFLEPRQYETHQNVSLRSNGVDRLSSLRKIPTRLRGTNLCPSSARFAPSFVSKQTVPNAPKWYKTHQNMSLGCNGGGSGAFIAKNSDATSWHEHFATKAPDPPHWTLNSCFGAFRTTGCVRCEKFRHDVMARTFALVRNVFASSFIR